MNLIHYAQEPFELDAFIDLPQNRKDNYKPRGLWVSDDDCEDNWINWCRDNNFRTEERHQYKHQVILHKDANVKIVKTAQGICALDKKYGVKMLPDHDWSKSLILDWRVLKEDYDGLIITPYIYSMRMSNSFWYYGWDCASGCIWNKRAIKEIKLLENY